MEVTNNTIAVPYDFSEKSNIAIVHAIQIASVVENKVLIVYFYEEPGLFPSKAKIKQKEDEVAEKIGQVIAEIKSKYNFSNIDWIFKNGKPKSVIKNIVEEKEISLFVMGANYDSENIQFNAYDFVNYIKEINTPVIFTKQMPINKYYRELVVPVEYDKKYKEELRWIIYLAKYYKCNVNLIRENFSDPYVKKHIENNVYFTKKMLDANKIVYGLKMAGTDTEFKNSVFKFANNIEADLIIMMSHKFKDYSCDKSNSLNEEVQTPVMVINPRADLKNYQGFY